MPPEEQRPETTNNNPESPQQEGAGPAPQHEQNPSLPRLRTMQYDASQYLKEKNVSFLDLVAREQEKGNEELYDLKDPITSRLWFKGLITLLIVALLGFAVYGIYTVFIKKPANLPAGSSAPRSLIAVETEEVITVRSGDRAALFERLRASRKDRLPSGSIRRIITKVEDSSGTVRFASIDDFFSTLDFRPPTDFVSNLNSSFNFFIYYTPSGANVGMILEPKNPERAFAQMIVWEPNMILDWRNVYFDQTVTATSRVFTDTVIKNVDVRTLDVAPDVNLSYGFFAGKYLLIATSRDFMELMINRLIVSPPVG